MRRTLLIALTLLRLRGRHRRRSATDPAYIVVDAGQRRGARPDNSDRRWPPASVTKLMTAYVTFKALKAGQLTLTSPIEMTAHAAAEPPSKMGFKPGSIMTLDNALKMMLVRSANDIAMAIGENVGGSEDAFVQRMNAEAQRLGMTGSHWANPNGLFGPTSTPPPATWPAGQGDPHRVPAIRAYFAIQGLKAGKQTLMGYNKLVGRYDGADGMKTGFVCPSGFNVVATATKNGPAQLIAGLLGETSAAARAETGGVLLRPRLDGVFGGMMSQNLANFRGAVALAVHHISRRRSAGESRVGGEGPTLRCRLSGHGSR